MRRALPIAAADALSTIKWWMRRDPDGPTLRQLRCTCKSYIHAEQGLRYLKRHRLVSWRNDGSGTRYAARSRS